MNKTLILTIFCVILSNCEIKPRQTQAQQPSTLSNYQTIPIIESRYSQFQYHTEIRDEMTYAVWTTTNYYGATTTVVNLTKEALEVELLKLQITETHKRLNQNQ